MEIKKAKPENLSEIMKIYENARRFMVQTGNATQWGTDWPPESLIIEDIKTEKCHICIENNKILGVFFYDTGEKIEPTYNVIENGEWMGDDTYGVIHRIASSGEVRGTGRFCIEYVLKKCGHIRIDTHENNKVMQNLLMSMGFKYCGIIHIEKNNEPRLAYEKI